MRWPVLGGFTRRLRQLEALRGRVVPPWIPVLLIGCTLALIPWTILLFFTLPSEQEAHHWDLAWGGLDIGIALVLATTATCIVRKSVWTPSAASAAATLLLVDSWFDITTAPDANQRMISVGMALLAEWPLAALCFYIARNVERMIEQVRRYALAAGFEPPRRGDPPEASPLSDEETAAAARPAERELA